VTRLLDRYVLREFVNYLLIGLSLFVGLFIIVDLFEKLDTFVDHKGRIGDVLLYYLYGLPFTVVLTVPVAMLLASLMVIGQITRSGELVAIISSGVSYFRLLVPVFAFAAATSVGTFALSEWVMPKASVSQKHVLEERIRQRSSTAVSRQRDVTYVGRDDRLFYIKAADPRREILRDVVIQQFNGERKVSFRLDSREAQFADGWWVFRRGYARAGMPAGEVTVPFNNFWMSDVSERPADFLRAEPDPLNMGRSGLADYMRRLRESRARTRKYEVEYHLKLAFPLIGFIIVLLGTGLSARIRRTGFAVGFGVSIALGFAYFAFVRAGQAIGYNGGLPPLVAAWLGNLVFLAVAVAFQIRASR
jgi:lipopolysaccharide export system permease protein